MADFSYLLGKTISEISSDSDTVYFTLADADSTKCQLKHFQNCCESVYIEDIAGDLQDLVGTPILMADEATSDHFEDRRSDDDRSRTWTFYKLATAKGYVTIRFYGSSNGYYSESVSFLVGKECDNRWA